MMTTPPSRPVLRWHGDRADLYHGDARDYVGAMGPADLLLLDPPYGVTSLAWDKVDGWWLDAARDRLRPAGSMWVFGSLRFFITIADDLRRHGWAYSQDVVWEKHNGSNFHADRFRRVHELAVQLYPDHRRWSDIYKAPVTTADAVRRMVKRKKGRPAHTGHIDQTPYASEDGGPRLMRSVIAVRSCHGHAEHPTQKPVGILDPLIRYSCPPGGLVADWMMGSGSTGVAALEAGRRFTGCEIDESYFRIACRRIDEASRSLLTHMQPAAPAESEPAC